MTFIKKQLNRLALLAGLMSAAAFTAMVSPDPEEGMYPLSEIHKIDLNKAGLKINPLEVYNPHGVSLVDALVNVGGCTGSFVSPDGLVITNHHCAFGAVQAASSVENDYITNGFLAKTRGEEIEAKGMMCQITESYEDVSDKILSSVAGVEDLAKRTETIRRKMKELAAEAEAKDKSIRASVSEMFEGQTYVLFRYKTIKDVRIVYVPPRSIGEFGGESDNWVWPRHTGDFSFVRAYVAPDGSPAPYSKDNVPYKPKKYLKINPDGVDEGDFVFILGYPGRTFRHKPSQFLEFQQKYQLSYISDLYDFQISTMENMGKNDPDLAIRFAARIKGLANVTKNYKGKLKGLRQLSLVEHKKDEEKKLQAFIDSKPELKEKFGNVLQETDKVYQEIMKHAGRDLWLGQIYRASTLLRLADNALDYQLETSKPDASRKSAFMEKNLPDFHKNIPVLYGSMSVEADRIFLKRMMMDAAKLPQESRIKAVDNVIKGKDAEKAINEFVDNALNNNPLARQEYFMELTRKPYNEVAALDNALIKFDLDLREQFKEAEEENNRIDGALDKLSAQLTEAKRLWKKTSFIPDANSTLRLTYGYVRGYSPADAVYYSPVTTLQGIIEKSWQGGDYEIPAKLRELFAKKDFGRFYSKKAKGLPVGILYNMDTTGGNSGSPVLNAKGEMIGVNFDRAYEATINDYAWSEDYSRSIGVDIRYVLWVTEKIGGAGFLLQEMGVK